MKNLFHKNLVLIISFVCAIGYAQAQTTYTLNGSLGVDTIPEHTLDVNGDGHFKGELLLDDDLRMTKLASGDILIERLVYIDEDGRMQRLGEGGAWDFEEYIHNLDCRYIDVDGTPMPFVYWNTGPGKITAHDEVCGEPNVGIGTHYPEARLDVRGTSYISEDLGLGTLNEGEARLVIRGAGSGILMRSIVDDGSGPVDKDVFEVKTNGRIAAQGMGVSQHALSIKNEGSDEENVIITGDGRTRLRGMLGTANAFEIFNADNGTNVPNFAVRGDGRVAQYVSVNDSQHAFRLRNTALEVDQELFNVRNNGRMQLKFIGDNEHLNVFRIERGNAPQVNDDSNIFAVKGTGRTQINFSGQPHQTAFGIKGGDDSSSDYLFHVKGDGHISAAAVHVRILGDFPDYVFEPGYELMPLEELRRYTADNQRLPNMPSAQEVERNGVDLGEMNRLLVEKVEELTLYVLQLEERLKAVEAK